MGTQVWLPLRTEGSFASTPRASKVPETCGSQCPGVEQGGGKNGGGTEECRAVLDTACKTPLHFALGYLTTSSRATPHPVANIQPLSLGHLSPNVLSLLCAFAHAVPLCWNSISSSVHLGNCGTAFWAQPKCHLLWEAFPTFEEG